MLSVCPWSVGTFWHAHSSVVSPQIDTRLAQYEAPVLGEHAAQTHVQLIIYILHFLQ